MEPVLDWSLEANVAPPTPEANLGYVACGLGQPPLAYEIGNYKNGCFWTRLKESPTQGTVTVSPVCISIDSRAAHDVDIDTLLEKPRAATKDHYPHQHTSVASSLHSTLSIGNFPEPHIH
jgi:hypothetical protein